ncbi:RCC1 domain-containing protein 1 isoform X2 [Hemicordylus capensis]|uniref:RCC1 domain-containing protein 1 isoform X2 n=1 Tax=Hemicordylus capensis TaxID=884348 RepID=UPI002303322F|nr:RCC1 domain-containing protein 1 isoform X2 [Hemicordylus capensis]
MVEARRGGWFQFGFRFEAAPAARMEPEPVSESAPVRAVRPSWSFAGIVAPAAVGSDPLQQQQLLLQGAVQGALPPDCLDLLPSETQVLLLRQTALEAWGVDSVPKLEGEPAWRRELLPEEVAATELPLVPGGYVAPHPPFFTPLPSALQARKLALGHKHVVLLSVGGALFTWGCGRHGQLGHGGLESLEEPRLLEALQGLPMGVVAAGGWHSAAVSEVGDLYIWGWNVSGQLALPSKAVAESRATTTTSTAAGRGAPEPGVAGDAAPESLPAAAGAFIAIQAFPALLDMPHMAEVSKVSCGSRHTAALTRKYGQLGHRDSASSDRARRVQYFEERSLRVVDVVCGPWSTYACAVGGGGAGHDGRPGAEEQQQQQQAVVGAEDASSCAPGAGAWLR